MYGMQTLHAGGIPMFRGTYLVDNWFCIFEMCFDNHIGDKEILNKWQLCYNEQTKHTTINQPPTDIPQLTNQP